MFQCVEFGNDEGFNRSGMQVPGKAGGTLKTFNRKGDGGETSLLFGRRVPKNDPHCQAYGAIDEVVSALGITRNIVTKDRVKDIILRVQKELFNVSAELAVQTEDYERFASSFSPTTHEMSSEMEKLISELESQVKMPDCFIIPGATLGSAWLDLCRAMTRRAERWVVTLSDKGQLKNEAVLEYLNRLADLLYTLARYEES